MNQLDLISPGALQPFVTCLEKRGIDASRYLERHRIPPAAVVKGFGKIAKHQMYRFFEDVAYREAIGTLGFLDGDPYPISELGSLGAALQQSVTLKDGIDTFSILLPRVAEGNTIWLVQGTDMSWLCCRTENIKRTDCVPDHTTVLVLREVIRLAGGQTWQPETIWFYTDPAPAVESFPGLAGSQVRFSQDVTAISFPTDLLHRSLILAPPGGNGYSAAGLPLMSIGDKLHLILETLQEHRQLPSADETAEMLGLSRTSLFRSLAREGTNYRQSIERVRYRAAVRLLEDPTLSVKEIGYELGYSSPGNFSRAFFRICGMTPTRFRSKQVNN